MTALRRKRGRPPKADVEKRRERLELRVSTAEKEAFKSAAAKSQQDLSVWIRIHLRKAVGDGLTEEDQPPIILNGAKNGDAKHG